jgi:hypothetical protein
MKLLLLIISSACLHAATNPPVVPVPVPSSPYLPRIYRYVDTLLEDPKQTANLHQHQNFLRLLYTLTDLSTKPKYRDAADAALRTWLDNIPSSDDKITRPWMLWNRCFEIAREPSTRFALAIVKSQTTNHLGFYLRACSAAYAHTTNAVFLQAIETLLKPFENSKAAPTLSFAIDCDGCAQILPEPIASRLRGLAERAEIAPGAKASPQTAIMYVSRYENSAKRTYRDALHAAANENLNFSPAADISPLTIGHSISLQLAAWRSTARQSHLDKARSLADLALTKFFDGTPEIRSGLDTLALSLVELHLHILYITAVRYPPNTLDR